MTVTVGQYEVQVVMRSTVRFGVSVEAESPEDAARAVLEYRDRAHVQRGAAWNVLRGLATGGREVVAFEVQGKGVPTLLEIEPEDIIVRRKT